MEDRTMTVSADIKYVGVNDHEIDLFEGQYIVPNGMAYNSYVIMDDKIAVMDTVDKHFTQEWLGNLAKVFGGRKPDYLIIQHMECDHSGSIMAFLSTYPDVTIVASAKAFTMLHNFHEEKEIPEEKKLEIKEGDTLNLGKHELAFVAAPMVHWPEVMMTYDAYDKVLFAADGFGKFGANDVEEDWACEARRYYIGIVGKYGQQVQNVLKKAAGLEIETICSLHGPVLKGDLSYYINLYDIWSSYEVETEGVAIFYTSVYGHTKKAVEKLAKKLEEKGCPKVVVNDLAREDMAECVEDAFRYGKIVLATTTYNADIFPFMRTFIDHLTERNFQKKHIGLIENGSWAPLAAKTMKKMLEGCKDIVWCKNTVKILSSMNEENEAQMDGLVEELTMDYQERHEEMATKNDLTALFKIGYGLYVVTSNDGKKDNGVIVNTVTQVTDDPNRIAVCINKKNYSHEIVKNTGIMNVNCLTVETPFSIFKQYGFQSGRDVDKFAGMGELPRTDNGLIFLPMYINAVMSLKVEQYVDLDTHGMFICTVEEARVLGTEETATYTYYQKHIKPAPDTEGKQGWVCVVCGYIYEGDELPDDFICPLCKHGVADFEKIG